ncbi:MAG: alanine--tRNA ligase-related protein [Thermoplasmata archaeon]|nr:alanyl-tRNA editing protein [Thermoplasmata archaeon]
MWITKTDKLYLDDSYLKEFEANVTEINNNEIALDSTAFYPEGGGQPSDQGEIISDRIYKVIKVYKDSDAVVHVLDNNFEGDKKIKGIIDWNLRYAHMRYHTAVHIMSGILFKEYGARITGSQIYFDKARMDINYDLKKEDLPTIEEMANKIIKDDLEVKIIYLKRSELRSDQVRVREDLLPDVDIIRIIDISGFDSQADGGTHVKKTSELKGIKISKYENKGKMNKRIYLNLL